MLKAEKRTPNLKYLEILVLQDYQKSKTTKRMEQNLKNTSRILLKY